MPIHNRVDTVTRNVLNDRAQYLKRKNRERQIESKKVRVNEEIDHDDILVKVAEIIENERIELVNEVRYDFIKQLKLLLSKDKDTIRDRKQYYEESVNFSANVLNWNYYDSTIIDILYDCLDGHNFYIIDKKMKDNKEIYDDEYIRLFIIELIQNLVSCDCSDKIIIQLNKCKEVYPIDILIPKILLKFIVENVRYDYYQDKFVESITSYETAKDFQSIYFKCLQLLRDTYDTATSSIFTPSLLYKYEAYDELLSPLVKDQTNADRKMINILERELPNYEKDIETLLHSIDLKRVKYYTLNLFDIDDILREVNDDIKEDSSRIFFITVNALFIEEYIETYRCYRAIDPKLLFENLKGMLLSYFIGFMKYKYMFFGETYTSHDGFKKTHKDINYYNEETNDQLTSYYLVYKYCYDVILKKRQLKYKRYR